MYLLLSHMAYKEGSEIDGEWLKSAIRAQKDPLTGKRATFRSTMTAMGIVNSDLFTEFAGGRAHINLETLAKVARLYPTMNMRFVLTGQGDPITTP